MAVLLKYHTIVADPPWEYPEGWPTGWASGRSCFRRDGGADTRRRTPLPYPSMSVADIAALPVDDLAAPDAHLYLWTTNRYLGSALSIVGGWGFSYSQTIVWCKPPRGIGPGGTFAQTTEYVIFARRGSLPGLRRLPSTWFAWPRAGHSRKPEASLDIFESVSPGPYLELFARRQRLGWDTWGNEALEHVTLEATAAT